MIQINSINRFTVGFSLLVLLIPYQSLAKGIDHIYTNHSGLTWGQTFKRIFNLSDYNKSYALVIGISRYTNFKDLATQNDAIKMKNFLLNEAGFDAVHLITEDKVSLNRIRTIMMDDLPRTLGEKDRFLFYWSGHGITDNINGQSFGYLPVSISGTRQFSSMINMRNLSSWDSRLKVKQSLYLLDACFSGLASHQVKSSQRNLTIKQISRPSRQILTAGLDNEEAIVIEGMGSLFTTAVIEGARGKADTASDGFIKDGIVSARELELYVKNRVARERQKNNWRKSITPLLTRFKHQPGDFFFYSKTALTSQPSIRVDSTSRVEGKSGSTKAQSGNHYHNGRAHSHKFPAEGLQHRHGNGALGKRQPSRIVTQQRQPARKPKQNNGRRIGQYIDHGNGTVTDTNTGLMWKKCSEGQTGNQCSGKAKTYNWYQAMKKFKQVSFAGKNDWRMPTIEELRTLVYCSNGTSQKQALDKGGCNKDFSITSDGMPAIRNDVFPKTSYSWVW